ncbi:hypothetical protein [Rhodoligotrophos defluvii]|uniref:hypothetical protein n=1 Tax=Rhodoligotrophos defluvii TaxID=2561934 RepID=UPI0010CA1050|nr:hypothetical protein [Rhodoligotrophos defluvii]
MSQCDNSSDSIRQLAEAIRAKSGCPTAKPAVPVLPGGATATFVNDGHIIAAQRGDVGSQHWVDVTRKLGTVILPNADLKDFSLPRFTADTITVTGKAAGQPVAVTFQHDSDRLDFVRVADTGRHAVAITDYDRDIREVTPQDLQKFVGTGELPNDPDHDHALHAQVSYASGAHFVTG